MGRHLLFLLLVALSGFHLGNSKKKLIKENDAIIDDADLMKDVSGDVPEEKDEADELKRDAAAAADDDDDDVDGGQDLSENLVDGEPLVPLDDLLRGWHRPANIGFRSWKRQNRACIRWYRGWWTADCSGADQVGVFYNRPRNLWCCIRAKRSDTCINWGGKCGLEQQCLKDGIVLPNNRGCSGKLKCCI